MNTNLPTTTGTKTSTKREARRTTKFLQTALLSTLFFLLFGVGESWGQVSSYVFSETTGTYTAITGGTQLVTTTAGATNYDTDGSYFTIPSGSQFQFNNTTITSVNMTADGALFLNPGTTTTGSNVKEPISSAGTAVGVIAGMGMDLRSTAIASQVYERRWEDVGTEVVFQWQNAARYLQSSSERFSFQIRVNKSNGQISVVYGNMTTITTSTTYQPMVGLRGSTNTEYNNRRLTNSIPDATPNWGAPNGTTAGNSNAYTVRFTSAASCFPASGLTFTWTPPACTAPTALLASSITTTSASLSWTAASPAPASGYEIYYSTSSTAPTAGTVATTTTGAGVVTKSITGLTANSTYYYWVRSNCNGTDKSSWVSGGSFATLCNIGTLPYTQDFESVAAGTIPNCTQVVQAGSGNLWNTVSNPGNGFTNMTLKYTYNLSNPANTWYFVNGLPLTAGVSYKLTYRYGTVSTATFFENLKVAYGSTATAAAMTTTLATHASVANGAATTNTVTFTPTTSGTYYIGFQCYSIADQNVLYIDDISVVNAPALASSGSTTAFSTCQSTASSAQSFSVSGNYLTANLVVTAPTGFEVSKTETGTYTSSVSYTLSSGTVSSQSVWVRMAALSSNPTSADVACTSTGATTVNVAVSGTVNSTPVAVTVTGGAICSGGTITASGGTGGTIYWQGTTSGGTSTTSSGTTSPVITAAGTYYARAQSSAGCWGTEGSASVTITAVPACVATGFSPADGNSSVNPAAGTTITWSAVSDATGYDVYFNGTEVSTNQSGTSYSTGALEPSTLYTWKVVPKNLCGSASSCSEYSFTTTTACTAPSISSTSTTNINCFGQSTGFITVNATGGTSPYQYSKDNGTTWVSSNVFGSLASGSYNIVVKGGDACIGAPSVVTLTQPAVALAVSASGAGSGCGGSTLSLSSSVSGGTSPYTYSWSNPSGLSSGTVDSPTATIGSFASHTLTVTDNNGCTASSSPVSITNNSPAAPTASNPAAICAGTPVNIVATSAGNSINWYSASTGGTALTTLVASGANYSVSPTTNTTYYAEAVVTTPGSQTFTYTGANQTWVVPAGVTKINVKTWGAGGGGSSQSYGGGASGAFIQGDISVTPGSTINFLVGQGGGTGSASTTYGGGGKGGSGTTYTGGAGGGRSAVQFILGTDYLTAAGGGGGAANSGYGYCQYGGGGGAYTGLDGGWYYSSTNAGKGGSITAGGAGGVNTGTPSLVGDNGSQYNGGNGGTNGTSTSTAGGGGGGGGYFGGGGGPLGASYSGGGGGGSSFANSAVNNITVTAGGTTSASCSAGGTAPNNSDANYISGVGIGGGGSSNGGNGLISISYSIVGCASTRTPVTVTVNAAPTANAGVAMAAICSGATSATLGGSFGGSATGGTWTHNGSGTLANASNPSTATYTAGASESGTVTLTLTTTGGGCTAVTATKTIVVNALPTVITISPTSATICNGNIQNLVASGGNIDTTSQIAVGPNIVSSAGAYSSIAFGISSFYNIFNVNVASRLVSVDIYPTATIGTSGSIVIANSSGTNLSTTNYTTTVTGGQLQTIVINYPMSVGTGYRIGQGGSGIALNRSQGASYPYTSTFANITGSNNGLSYYYAYNMIFEGTSSTQSSITWSPTTALYSNSGATTAYTGTNSSTVYAKPTTTTTYTATATSAEGCTSSNTVQVSVDPISVGGTIAGGDTVCSGTNSTTLTLSGHTGNVTKWQSSTSSTFASAVTDIANTTTSLTASNLTTTTYYRAVVTSGVCSAANSATATVTVNQPSVAPTSISGTTTICNGASTTLTAVGGTLGTGANYHWGTGSIVGTNEIAGTGSSITVSPTSDTTYWVRITNATSPCTSSTDGITATITVNPLPTATITAGSATTFCSGGSVVLTASAGSSYVWKKGGVAISLATAQTYTATTAGAYTVTVTNSNSCSATSDATTVTVNALPGSATSSHVTLCGTGSVTLTATDPGEGYTINWYNTAQTVQEATASLTYITPSISTTTTYYAEMENTSTGCKSQNRTAVQAIVNATNTFTGGVSGSETDWFAATNWSCGTLPNATTNVVIPTAKTVSVYYNVNGAPAYANTIVLEGTANVTVTSDHSINVTNKVTVASGSSFTVQNNASLVQTDNVANEGNIIVQKSTPSNRLLKRNDAVLWSSPVVQNLQAISTGTPAAYFMEHNPQANSWSAVSNPASANFTKGKGFLIRTPSTFPTTATQQWSVNFTGVPNNGNVTLSAGSTEATEKYLLVGNPYPSAISIAAFRTANPNITGVFYFYRKPNGVTSISGYGTLAANGQFSTNDADNLVGALTPGDVIASGQGFFVAMKSDNNNGEVYFTNAMRVANDHGHFNRVNTNLDSYKLIVKTPVGGNSQMIMNYDSETTNGYDVGYDAVAFTDGTTDFSSIMANEKYRIQSKGEYNAADVIPVQFKTGTAGEHRIKLQDAQGVFAADQMVIIKDNLTGVQHNLTANGDYVFTATAGTFTNRFEVIYQQAYYTALQANSCGATIANMSSLVYADIVNGATGYRFKVVNNTTAAVQTIDRPQHWFAFNMLSAYDYNTPYTISVQVQKDGVWTGYYGASCSVNSPNIATTGIMQINPSQCGMTLPTIGTVIATTPVAGATGYKFRITNTTANAMGNNLVQEITRTNHWFTLGMLSRYNYGSSYAIEVAVKTTGAFTPYGNACTVYAPAVPTLASCGQTVATATTLVRTTAMTLATQYRFQVIRMSTQETITFDTANFWFSFRVNVPGYAAGEQYGVRVAVMTAGAWSPYGDACDITAPIATARTTEEATPSEANLFKPVAYPNPFASTFGISLATPSADVVHVMVYDLQGRLIEKQNVFVSQLDSLQIGTNYPSGDYLLVVAQGANIKSSHIHKE